MRGIIGSSPVVSERTKHCVQCVCVSMKPGQDDRAGPPHHALCAVHALDFAPGADSDNVAAANHDGAVVDDRSLGIHGDDAAANDEIADFFLHWICP